MHVIIASEVSNWQQIDSFLGCSLGLDHGNQNILLVLCSLVCSKLGSSVLDGFLLFGGDSSTDHFHHLLLEWGEATDFPDDLSDSLNSLANSSFSGDWSCFPCLGGWSGNLVSCIESYINSTSVVGLTHVFYKALSK